VKINTLLKRLQDGKLTGDGGVEVQGITHDSRSVRKGSVFAAIPGEHAHGVTYVDRAVAAGAAAVLSDRHRPKRIGVPWIKVKQVRPAMARAAWILAGNPQKKLGMIGVTGTNGKSTTAHLISVILNAAGRPTVFVGTLGVILPDGTEIASERTTPEATDLAPILRRALKAGAENGKRGYELTFAIAYIRDFMIDYYLLGESFETSVPWSQALSLCENVNRRIREEHAALFAPQALADPSTGGNPIAMTEQDFRVLYLNCIRGDLER